MSLFRDVPELLVRYRSGEPAALSRVYRHYVRQVDTYLQALARFARAPELAQASAIGDLIQEVFIRTFSPSARASYDGLREFSPYLNAIARNCFVDALRRRRHELSLDAADLSLTAEGAMPDERYDPKVLAVLEAYLESLSPELDQIYEERFVLGLSQEEACQRLRLSRRKLRTSEEHLRRGLRKALLLAGSCAKAPGSPSAPLPRRSAERDPDAERRRWRAGSPPRAREPERAAVRPHRAECARGPAGAAASLGVGHRRARPRPRLGGWSLGDRHHAGRGEGRLRRLTAKGSGVTSASGQVGIDVGCAGPSPRVCPLGSTLMFFVTAAPVSSHLGAYAERLGEAGGERIWYFPDSEGAAPHVAASSSARVLPQGVRLEAPHTPGLYRVKVWLSQRPVQRDEPPADALTSETLRLEITP